VPDRFFEGFKRQAQVPEALDLGQMETNVVPADMNLERKVKKNERGDGDESRTLNAASGSGPAVGGLQVHRVSLVLGGQA
jgi:hypothetical protein